MIDIDEPTLPERSPAELRALADRHAARVRRRARRRATGIAAAATAVVLAFVGTGVGGTGTDVHTFKPASPDHDRAAGTHEGAPGPSGDMPGGGRRPSGGEARPRGATGPQGASPGGPTAVPDAPRPADDTGTTRMLFARSTSGGPARLWELTVETGQLRKVHDTGWSGRWSPDGRQVVFDSDMQIKLLDVASGTVTTLVDGSGFYDGGLDSGASGPVWVSQHHVVFMRARHADSVRWVPDLWLVDTRTRAIRHLAEGSEPSSSNDGRILYRELHGEYRLTDTTGADLGTVPNSDELSHAVLSPDGRSLTASRWHGTGTASLVVQDLEGSNLRALAGGGTETRPAWFPDGTAVAFVPHPDRAPEPDTPWGIWAVAVDGSGLRRLTDAGGGYDAAPDLILIP